MPPSRWQTLSVLRSSLPRAEAPTTWSSRIRQRGMRNSGRSRRVYCFPSLRAIGHRFFLLAREENFLVSRRYSVSASLPFQRKLWLAGNSNNDSAYKYLFSSKEMVHQLLTRFVDDEVISGIRVEDIEPFDKSFVTDCCASWSEPGLLLINRFSPGPDRCSSLPKNSPRESDQTYHSVPQVVDVHGRRQQRRVRDDTPSPNTNSTKNGIIVSSPYPVLRVPSFRHRVFRQPNRLSPLCRWFRIRCRSRREGEVNAKTNGTRGDSVIGNGVNVSRGAGGGLR